MYFYFVFDHQNLDSEHDPSGSTTPRASQISFTSANFLKYNLNFFFRTREPAKKRRKHKSKRDKKSRSRASERESSDDTVTEEEEEEEEEGQLEEGEVVEKKKSVKGTVKRRQQQSLQKVKAALLGILDEEIFSLKTPKT